MSLHFTAIKQSGLIIMLFLISLIIIRFLKSFSDANLEKLSQGGSFSSFIIIWALFSFVVVSGKL